MPDASPDVASPDITPPDIASPDVASPDIALPDVATCSGTNPAAQKCRRTPNDCIPSLCECTTNGFWGCTTDCLLGAPLCADAGVPDVASDGGVPISDGGTPRTFTRTGSMTAARTKHTATLLANGKVLIAGGSTGNTALASAELYDPATGSFAATGTLTAARLGHTATLLAGGKVLIVSGSSAELYDPATGTFTATDNPTVARTEHTATLLTSGKVLVAGGYSGADALVSAELYDPATGKFTATGNLTVARRQHAATLLQSGMVLLAGGFVPPTNTGNSDGLASAELYDPTAATFTATGSMQARRSPAIATLLADGTVLVGGGWHGFEGYFDTSTLELYDPATGQFAPTGGMAVKRALYTATLLPNGLVLIAGGYQHAPSSFVYLSSAESYDPAASTCTPTASMAEQREYHSATALPDGTILVAGGDRFGSAPALASAEIYK
jgi:hypothetical protein